MSDPRRLRTQGALSAVMMAAAFVTEPEVWPGFIAYVERTTGRDVPADRAVMDVAIRIVDSLQRILAEEAGLDPGTPYPGMGAP